MLQLDLQYLKLCVVEMASMTALVVANDYSICSVPKYVTLRATIPDSLKIVTTFRNLGFSVSHQTNLGFASLIACLESLVEEKESLVLCFTFCGYGEEGMLVSQEGRLLPICDILEQFHGTTRPHLADKLKLLFIDACRGQKQDRGVVTWQDYETIVTTRGARVLDKVLLSEHNNCIIAYATQLGYQSRELHHQDGTDEGVWMPILASTIASRDACILHVMIEVNYLVQKKCEELKIFYQAPEVIFSLTRDVNRHRLQGFSIVDSVQPSMLCAHM